MKRYRVRVLPDAEAQLERLFDHVLERELAASAGNPQLAFDALHALRVSFESLGLAPFSCRKAGADPFWRELIIPFGHAGYVALFEIRGDEVLVAKVRHQREDDYL